MLVIIFVEHTQLLESINLKMLESGPQLFLGAPWTEKMTFSQKTGHDRFGRT